MSRKAFKEVILLIVNRNTAMDRGFEEPKGRNIGPVFTLKMAGECISEVIFLASLIIHTEALRPSQLTKKGVVDHSDSLAAMNDLWLRVRKRRCITRSH